MKTTADKRDITDQVELQDRWTVGLYGKTLIEMPLAVRFDYEFRLQDGGIHLFRRDPEEGKVG